MLAMCFLFTILLVTLMATPYGGKIMFLIWICLIFSLIGGMLTLTATGIAW